MNPDPTLQVSIGIATKEVKVALIGSTAKMDRSANTGSGVHGRLASRVQLMAQKIPCVATVLDGLPGIKTSQAVFANHAPATLKIQRLVLKEDALFIHF